MDLTLLAELKHLRVLYVEDDDTTREELAAMLGYWVGELDVAPDGLAGLGLFELRRPHIVVTDLQMPVMSGLEMCEAIRKISRSQPILALSAHNDEDYAGKARGLGVRRYMTKPVNVEALLTILAEMAADLPPPDSIPQPTCAP